VALVASPSPQYGHPVLRLLGALALMAFILVTFWLGLVQLVELIF
jgi:hypothetical protein